MGRRPKNFVADETEYELKAILKRRTRKGVNQYLIHWEGYSVEEATWEPHNSIKPKEMVDQFDAKWELLQKSKMRRARAEAIERRRERQEAWEEIQKLGHQANREKPKKPKPPQKPRRPRPNYQEIYAMRLEAIRQMREQHMLRMVNRPNPALIYDVYNRPYQNNNNNRIQPPAHQPQVQPPPPISYFGPPPEPEPLQVNPPEDQGVFNPQGYGDCPGAVPQPDNPIIRHWEQERQNLLLQPANLMYRRLDNQEAPWGENPANQNWGYFGGEYNGAQRQPVQNGPFAFGYQEPPPAENPNRVFKFGRQEPPPAANPNRGVFEFGRQEVQQGANSNRGIGNEPAPHNQNGNNGDGENPNRPANPPFAFDFGPVLVRRNEGQPQAQNNAPEQDRGVFRGQQNENNVEPKRPSGIFGPPAPNNDIHPENRKWGLFGAPAAQSSQESNSEEGNNNGPQVPVSNAPATGSIFGTSEAPRFASLSNFNIFNRPFGGFPCNIFYPNNPQQGQEAGQLNVKPEANESDSESDVSGYTDNDSSEDSDYDDNDSSESSDGENEQEPPKPEDFGRPREIPIPGFRPVAPIGRTGGVSISDVSGQVSDANESNKKEKGEDNGSQNEEGIKNEPLDQ